MEPGQEFDLIDCTYLIVATGLKALPLSSIASPCFQNEQKCVDNDQFFSGCFFTQPLCTTTHTTVVFCLWILLGPAWEFDCFPFPAIYIATFCLQPALAQSQGAWRSLKPM